MRTAISSRRTRDRVAALAAVALATVVMAGCAAEPAPRLTARPTATPSAASPSASTPAVAPTTPTTSAEATAVCTDGVLQLSGSAQALRFDGECARVEISGADLDVDLDDARITSVIVRGDRNEVDLDAPDDVTVEGQGNDIDAETVGAATIRGDRNRLDVDDALGSLTISGNDNAVEADTIGAADVQGDRNLYPGG